MSSTAHPTPDPASPSAVAGFLGRAWRFLRDRRGVASVYFGLTAIPLIIAAGAAIDISRAYLVKQRLCYALDAAGLAVGSSTGTTDQLNAALQAYFTANYPTTEIGVPTTPVLVQSGRVLTVSAEATVDTTLMKLVGIGSTTVGCSAEITKSSLSLEIGLVLDNTGSMAGQKIADLKTAANDLIDIVVQDVQDPFYSKVAVVPYSNGVNAGSYAAAVRGAIPGPKTVTDISWFKSASKNITGATKANPVVITSAAHGFANGDVVRITGVSGMTQLNNNIYTVAGVTTNTFQLQGVNGTAYSTYTSSGTVRSCLTAGCAPVVTAAAHGFATNDRVYFSSVVGTTQVNGNSYPVTNLTANTFALTGVNPFTPTAFSAYTSGGNAYCTTTGCEWFYFTNGSTPSATRTFQVSTCVSERNGANAFTDAAPSTTLLGKNYPASNNPCIATTMMPMTSDKTALHTTVNAMSAGGSTGGHIGVAWGWYLVSPNFGYLFPSISQPAAYGTPLLQKIVIIMTDGEYNSIYCNGVIAQDSLTGSGNLSDHINCNGPNGDTYTQAKTMCTNMKAQGVMVYTVGFNVVSAPAAQDLLSFCATDSAHYYQPVTGSDLIDVFHQIAQSISNLRLSR